MEHSLNKLQQWFQTIITHASGVEAGVVSSSATNLIDVAPSDIQRVILPSKEMSSLDRLRIYGNAYFGRLIECMRGQFPAFYHAVGEESFSAFAFGYLNQSPSRSYSLGPIGNSFDQYLSATRPPRTDPDCETEADFADFMIDLARLEQVYSDVFDGPGPESSPPALDSLIEDQTAESFADRRLILFDSVRLLQLRFPVHEYASAVRHGQESLIPEARFTYLVVNRRDYIVRRFEVTRPQFELLKAIQNHATIGEALATVSASADVEMPDLIRSVELWFEQWTAALLFAKLE